MPTRIKGSGRIALGAGEEAEIKPEFFTSQERHAQFTVANDTPLPSDPTTGDSMLYLLGDNGKEATPIPPQQAITIVGDALVTIKAASTNTGNVYYVIGQVFDGKIEVDK